MRRILPQNEVAPQSPLLRGSRRETSEGCAVRPVTLSGSAARFTCDERPAKSLHGGLTEILRCSGCAAARSGQGRCLGTPNARCFAGRSRQRRLSRRPAQHDSEEFLTGAHAAHAAWGTQNDIFMRRGAEPRGMYTSLCWRRDRKFAAEQFRMTGRESPSRPVTLSGLAARFGRGKGPAKSLRGRQRC
jgi:hypothetical protein